MSDWLTSSQWMLGLVGILALSVLWGERRNHDTFVFLAIGLGLGIGLGHLASQ